MQARKPIDAVCESDSCTGCGVCAVECRFGAISMIEDEEGFLVPSICHELCTGCRSCMRICPSMNAQTGCEADFYMAWNKDRSVLEECSSGGVFDALASWTFMHGGAVFGVKMDASTWKLSHVAVDNAAGLNDLRKSKYYQSDMSGAYEEAVHYLKEGRWVLFTGTACQIAAVNALAAKEQVTQRLVTMDVLCHGVTSRKVVTGYLDSREREVGARVVGLTFRTKKTDKGWAKGSSITTTTHAFSNGTKDIVDDEDLRGLFFSGFNRNLFLRECCYQCRYCGTRRISDFTAADYWGISQDCVSPWQYHHGVSLLLVSSEKGREILSDLGEWLHVEPTEKEDAISHNLALERPSVRPQLRDTFFSDLVKHGYSDTIRKYYRMDLYVGKIKRRLRRLVGDGFYGLIKSAIGKR